MLVFHHIINSIGAIVKGKSIRTDLTGCTNLLRVEDTQNHQRVASYNRNSELIRVSHTQSFLTFNNLERKAKISCFSTTYCRYAKSEVTLISA